MIKSLPLGVALGCDTSENLNASQYAFLKSKGYTWIARYVPLSGQSPTSYGVIQPSEFTAALQSGMAVMLVQFPRTSGWSATTGLADGKEAAAYALSLGYPTTACIWADMSVAPTGAITVAYMNAWYEGLVQGGMSASAGGVYFEPGVPLTAQQRYSEINVPRYWATGANDPERFPAHRGCQLIQLWGSSNGELFPEPGLVIDADVSQLDYFGNPAVAAVGP